MKTKINFLKTALLAIALMMGTTQIFAQTPGQFPTPPTGTITQPSDLNGGLVTFDGTNESFTAVTTNTVLFLRPTTVNPIGSGANLQATLDDNGTAPGGVPFSSYLWYKVSYDAVAGTETEGTAISAATTNLYSPTNLDPGYNKFRVRGEVGTGVSCPSTEYQDVIVFVLPPLDVTPTFGGTSITYCENDVPTGAAAIILSASITADYTGNTNDYPKPLAADFSKMYNWYAIPASAPTTTISLGTTPTVDLSTLATPLAPDTYTFYLDVEYATSIRDNTVANRTYVVYGGNGTATTQTVVVTETPATPTITVTGVSD